MSGATTAIVEETVGYLKDQRKRLVVELERLESEIGTTNDAIQMIDVALDGDGVEVGGGAEGSPRRAAVDPSTEPKPARKAPKRRQTTQKAGAVAKAPPSAARPSRAEVTERQAATIQFIRERSPVSAVDLVDAGLEPNHEAARRRLHALSSNGQVRRAGERKSDKGGRPQKLFEIAGEVAPADHNGAKTGPERRLVEALARAPVALTTNEAARNADVKPLIDAAPMLQGLARRGVVHEVRPESSTAPRRWELPTGTAE